MSFFPREHDVATSFGAKTNFFCGSARNNVKGTIPSELGLLTALTKLDLGKDCFSIRRCRCRGPCQ